MPNSFTKLYIHHVSAVKYREALILPEFEEELYKFILGLTRELDQTPIQVNGMHDHIHIAARLRSTMNPATFVQKIKANSSRWVNERGFLNNPFAWQKGGATFSVSEAHVPRVRNYIKNQKAHHRKKTFKYEYLDLLEQHDIVAEPEYLPDFFELDYSGVL